MTTSKPKCAVITGICGGLARLVAAELYKRGYKIVGVDYRPMTSTLPFEADIYHANYNKTRIEDIFRWHEPTHVLHLGRVGNLKEQEGKRFDLNVMGSRKVMDLCFKYSVARLLVLSTFHIYGAHPHNHIPIYEDDPLRAGTELPQIADAIQLDGQALLWSYRHPQVGTILLRPCNIVGPHIRNAITNLLRESAAPVLMGFNPMMQFVHQQDLTLAIVASIESNVTGVFNVAGSGSVPWRDAINLAGARAITVPSPLVVAYLKFAGLFSQAFPPYLINFFKYPCIISDQALRQAINWAPTINPMDAIRSAVHGKDLTGVTAAYDGV